MTQPFCCDITSGTTEEQNEFKRLYNKASNKNWGYGTIYYGVDKYGVFDCGSDINYVINFMSKVIHLSEGISILKKMVGEEEKKEERTYSLNEVREIALEYYNLYLYAESHKLTRFELQSELIKINQKYNLDYKEGVDFNQPKPTE